MKTSDGPGEPYVDARKKDAEKKWIAKKLSQAAAKRRAEAADNREKRRRVYEAIQRWQQNRRPDRPDGGYEDYNARPGPRPSGYDTSGHGMGGHYPPHPRPRPSGYGPVGYGPVGYGAQPRPRPQRPQGEWGGYGGEAW